MLQKHIPICETKAQGRGETIFASTKDCSTAVSELGLFGFCVVSEKQEKGKEACLWSHLFSPLIYLL